MTRFSKFFIGFLVLAVSFVLAINVYSLNQTAIIDDRDGIASITYSWDNGVEGCQIDCNLSVTFWGNQLFHDGYGMTIIDNKDMTILKINDLGIRLKSYNL